MRARLLAIALLALSSLASAQPFTVEDLVALRRVSDPQLSPDSKTVAFVVWEPGPSGEGVTQVWLRDLGDVDATPRHLTEHSAASWSPRWAPDGRSVFFLSSRSGTAQVWRQSIRGDAQSSRVTDYPLDVTTFRIAPRGERIALTMRIRPGCVELECAPETKRSSSGRVYDQLFVRHWDTWDDGARSQLFVASLHADGPAGEPTNVSGRVQAHVPSRPSGGSEEYAFSPDGSRIVFSARMADAGEAWSTNFDLYEVAVDGKSEPRNLTSSNAAWDTQPVFLRDGALAYLATARPGVESDKFTIRIRDARSGVSRELATNWDRSIRRLALGSNGQLLATADDQGQTGLFAIDILTGRVEPMVATGQVSEFSAAAGHAVVAWASLTSPPDLFLAGPEGLLERVTEMNQQLLSARELSATESFSFAGWNDERVMGYVVKPASFRPDRQYPVAFLVHGGPESTFLNRWDWRWNPQVFAAHGYAVVMIDFHGSTGYGQRFTDSIAKDWGGKPLVDLKKGLAAALARFPWLDSDCICSLGPSYGGYMQNWFESQWSSRFKCLVNHAGIFDVRAMYYTTDELWFMDFENGGPYFAGQPSLEQFNPATYVSEWKTPMLVIHGGLDYRVPYSQGLASFTALQRRGVQSKFLYFPDENHWIRRPSNLIQWYETVLDWLDEHLRPRD